ncbi:Antibiotic biosynthesis monooxygenase [Gloeothece citriformis PCC 7424]|uniref:Antibiotic biosynthesis monooxygenase n=1 Tax=Gloeothece citriformis (strain PCC 7424) TaxID=65393 RepID=B7KDK1_GLOC7|nr:putative quinol monooxygenase [Gloeothece citriformis]ACK70303.1 Antibiotic biosynthesis monooxygenase [Gloeothece citriformis PCC 7424]
MTKNYLRVVARVMALPDKIEDLKLVFFPLVEATRQEKGCLQYELLHNQNDPTEFIFVETWETKECLEAHMKTEHFQIALKQLDGLVATDPDIQLYDQLL